MDSHVTRRIVTTLRNERPHLTEAAASILAASNAQRLVAAGAALADPVRVQLLAVLAAAGEVCSCDLEAPLERSQPTISHHTRILCDAGLIVGEKRGRWMWWRLNEPGWRELQQTLARLSGPPLHIER